MSHFTVLVVTPEKPTEDSLTPVLQPWHEYECTGVKDQYVVPVDCTEKARAEYETGTTTRLRDPDGGLHEPWDEKFYREPTPEEEERIGPMAGSFGAMSGLSYTSRDWGDGQGYRPKVKFVPEGWEQVDLPKSELETFREFVAEYYEYPEVLPGAETEGSFVEVSSLDETGTVLRVVRYTNPNAKWDWWTIGGRWTGLLQVKPGATGALGSKAAFGSAAEPGTADILQRRDLDVDTARAKGAEEYAAMWDKARAAAGSLPLPEEWGALINKHKDSGAEEWRDAARAEYYGQPAVAALKEAFPDSWDLENELRALEVDRNIFCAEGADAQLSTYAYVHQGEWHGRGEMGWWGMSRDEKETPQQWARRFNQMLDTLPEESWLTVVDCHI